MMKVNLYEARVRHYGTEVWRPVTDKGEVVRKTEPEMIVHLTHLSNWFTRNEYQMFEVKNA